MKESNCPFQDLTTCKGVESTARIEEVTLNASSGAGVKEKGGRVDFE